MELRQLGYFAAVARHRHFTRAADALHVTQSALSQGVRKLEDELGVALLRRDGRGVELTAAGEELLPRAEAMLGEAAAARAEMDAHAGLVRGIVRVAATAGDATGLPAALAAFHRERPGIRIGLRQGTTAQVLELVRTGAVDLAIASSGDADGLDGAGVRATALGDEPLVAIAAPGDPLGSAGEVTLWDLRERPLILAEPGSGLRATVLAACVAAGFSPVPLFEVGDPVTVRYLAHAGLGVSVVPASWARAPTPAVAVARIAGPAGGGAAPRHRVALLRAAGAAGAAELLFAHLVGAGGLSGG